MNVSSHTYRKMNSNTFGYRLMFGILWQQGNQSLRIPVIESCIDGLWDIMSDEEKARIRIQS